VSDAATAGGVRRNKQDRNDRKKNKGANKGRRWTKVHDGLNLCWRLAAGKTCEFGSEYAVEYTFFLLLYPQRVLPDAALHTTSQHILRKSHEISTFLTPPISPQSLHLFHSLPSQQKKPQTARSVLLTLPLSVSSSRKLEPVGMDSNADF
jgi:hypothetical protein